jgi:hypothetical protein
VASKRARKKSAASEACTEGIWLGRASEERTGCSAAASEASTEEELVVMSARGERARIELAGTGAQQLAHASAGVNSSTAASALVVALRRFLAAQY